MVDPSPSKGKPRWFATTCSECGDATAASVKKPGEDGIYLKCLCGHINWAGREGSHPDFDTTKSRGAVDRGGS